ncbi:MAG: flagellar basal body P-ring formation protein FlgA [Gammaproteobacteria bacterium]|nr:flagellar basal body P-ring formation protein FlgA [Gammaproteobacteria bacterium]
MNKLKLISIIIFILSSFYSSGADVNDPRRIHINQLVNDFIKQKINADVEEKVSISVNKIDRRIKIQDCDKPLSLSLAGKNKISRHTTVAVKCENKWKMYIPVKIKRLRAVVIASQALAAGALLNRSNLTLAYQDILLLRGTTLSNIATIEGSKLIRQVQSGQTITSNLLCLVCKGEPVSIFVHSGNLTIKSTGIALKSGINGQVIAVRNTSSGRVIEATITAVATVEIKI